MALMPMAAAVPTTVATTAAIRATTRLRPRALKIISLWNRLLYHLKVKPVKMVRLLLSLKLNTAITAMGTYMKENSSTRYTRCNARR